MSQFTLSKNTKKSVQEKKSGHGDQHTSSSQVSDESDLTLVELTSRSRGQKTKSLK